MYQEHRSPGFSAQDSARGKRTKAKSAKAVRAQQRRQREQRRVFESQFTVDYGVARS